MSGSNLTYRSDGGVHHLDGVFDETAAPVLAALGQALAQNKAAPIVFDLAKVRRINSLGVRAWVDFLRPLTGRNLAFRRCSPAFVDQLNTVSDFRGGGKIESVLAPYVCETSGNVFYEELTIGKDLTRDNFAALSGRRCSECPEPLVFDDLPERYLHFLSFA